MQTTDQAPKPEVDEKKLKSVLRQKSEALRVELRRQQTHSALIQRRLEFVSLNSILEENKRLELLKSLASTIVPSEDLIRIFLDGVFKQVRDLDLEKPLETAELNLLLSNTNKLNILSQGDHVLPKKILASHEIILFCVNFLRKSFEAQQQQIELFQIVSEVTNMLVNLIGSGSDVCDAVSLQFSDFVYLFTHLHTEFLRNEDKKWQKQQAIIQRLALSGIGNLCIEYASVRRDFVICERESEYETVLTNLAQCLEATKVEADKFQDAIWVISTLVFGGESEFEQPLVARFGRHLIERFSQCPYEDSTPSTLAAILQLIVLFCHYQSFIRILLEAATAVGELLKCMVHSNLEVLTFGSRVLQKTMSVNEPTSSLRSAEEVASQLIQKGILEFVSIGLRQPSRKARLCVLKTLYTLLTSANSQGAASVYRHSDLMEKIYNTMDNDFFPQRCKAFAIFYQIVSHLEHHEMKILLQERDTLLRTLLKGLELKDTLLTITVLSTIQLLLRRWQYSEGGLQHAPRGSKEQLRSLLDKERFGHKLEKLQFHRNEHIYGLSYQMLEEFYKCQLDNDEQ